MGYRGRLIWPVLVRLAQLDTTETAADPDVGGALTSGYDDDFREPVRLPVSGGGPGTVVRAETLSDFLPAQIEVSRWDDRRQAFSGNLPEGSVLIVFHFSDLEERDMIDANGEAKIRVGDRLEGIYQYDDQALVQRPSIPLFAVQPQPNSFGLDGLRRNLLLLGFAPRDAGAMSP